MVLQDSALLVAAALWPLSAYLFPSAPLCRRRQAAHSAKAGLLSCWRLEGPGPYLFPSAPFCRRRQAAHSAKAGLLSRWRLAGPGTGLAARPCLGSSILL